MKNYSDMTIWELQAERTKIENELSRRLLGDIRVTISPNGVCNCGAIRRGELTGSWQCPVHGQQF